MYDFTDTIEQAAADKLPAEAVSINGVYIEDERLRELELLIFWEK